VESTTKQKTVLSLSSRLPLDLAQQALAAKLGVDPDTINLIVTGEPASVGVIPGGTIDFHQTVSNEGPEDSAALAPSSAPGSEVFDPSMVASILRSQQLESGLMQKYEISLVARLQTGVVSVSKGSYEFLSTATLDDVEKEIRKVRKVDERETLAFFITDLATGDDFYQAGSLPIGELVRPPKSVLSLRPPEPGEVPVSMGVSPAADLDAMDITVSSVRPVQQPPKTYRFVIPVQKKEFELELPVGATVRDARAAVGQKCHSSLDDITLLFLGKTLKDQFVLDRMRIGNKQITVSVKDARTVILKTVLAHQTQTGS
jgi:hypothetical protein